MLEVICLLLYTVLVHAELLMVRTRAWTWEHVMISSAEAAEHCTFCRVLGVPPPCRSVPQPDTVADTES